MPLLQKSQERRSYYSMTKYFIQLIQIYLGHRDKLSAIPTENEWKRIFSEAQRQSLIGILFSAIEQIPLEQKPPKAIKVQWWAMTQTIEEQSHLMEERSHETYAFFANQGINCAILKGQSVACLYPYPYRRQSGDVDIWLNIPRDQIYRMAREHDPNGIIHGANYHHIHYQLFPDCEVEVHIYPSFLSNPFLNHQLHSFFRLHPPLSGKEYLDNSFNRIFILMHCFRHLNGHGVGLRQLMDYYYVLRQGYTEEERKETLLWIKRLRLTRFTKGVMWILREVFKLEEQYILLEPDKKEGLFILSEIHHTGNMGHYDHRNWGSLKTPLSRFFFNLRRSFHFITHYPQESFWQPLFSIWLNIWRRWKHLGNPI